MNNRIHDAQLAILDAAEMLYSGETDFLTTEQVLHYEQVMFRMIRNDLKLSDWVLLPLYVEEERDRVISNYLNISYESLVSSPGKDEIIKQNIPMILYEFTLVLFDQLESENYHCELIDIAYFMLIFTVSYDKIVRSFSDHVSSKINLEKFKGILPNDGSGINIAN